MNKCIVMLYCALPLVRLGQVHVQRDWYCVRRQLERWTQGKIMVFVVLLFLVAMLLTLSHQICLPSSLRWRASLHLSSPHQLLPSSCLLYPTNQPLLFSSRLPAAHARRTAPAPCSWRRATPSRGSGGGDCSTAPSCTSSTKSLPGTTPNIKIKSAALN
jgi:hypothetical protein